MKKAIAMKCSQEQWDSIKGRIPEGIKKSICKFGINDYLTNYFCEIENNIANITMVVNSEKIHETFNAKIFLEACGIETDVYEITKEQLKSLIEAAVCNIKDYVMNNDGFIDDWMKDAFPDAFKKELEVGKWYKAFHKGPNEQWGLINIAEIKSDRIYWYGFFDGIYIEKDWCHNENGFEEATLQEVEAALICEAEKRGLLDGIHYLSPKGYKRIVKYPLELSNNILSDADGNYIFYSGKWATIIETITKEEAEKILNKKIV